MKKYLVTGLLIWIPVVITLWVLHAIVTTVDSMVLAVVPAWRPESWFGYRIPGLGLLLTLVVLILTGVAASNLIGQRLVRATDAALARIPVVKSIYSGVKQVSDTLFTPGGQAFRRALLVQYPRAGSWTVAFLTGQPAGEVADHLGRPHVSVYVPTTPNPTSGFFLLVPRDEVVELRMSVDEALKYVISMGVVPPKAARGMGELPPGERESMG